MRVVLVLVVLAMAWKGYFQWQDAKANPQVIKYPVYAEAHITKSAKGRDLELVMLAQMVDQADCSGNKADLAQQIGAVDGWQVQSAECKSELDPRYAQLFDNTPVLVTYTSLGRGERHEREMRMVAWGLTVPESDKLCDVLVQKYSHERKGEVKCVRAAG